MNVHKVAQAPSRWRASKRVAWGRARAGSDKLWARSVLEPDAQRSLRRQLPYEPPAMRCGQRVAEHFRNGGCTRFGEVRFASQHMRKYERAVRWRPALDGGLTRRFPRSTLNTFAASLRRASETGVHIQRKQHARC